MSAVVDFSEAAADHKVRSLPLAHLSLEVGHLYFEDFAAGAEGLRRYFQQVAPWVEAARGTYSNASPVTVGRSTPRISTCFLLDDYFGPTSSPREVLPMLLRAATEGGVRIDYLARESACAAADGVPLASLVAERIVADPPPGTTGSRPPASEIGWLCNGQRSPSGAAEAMRPTESWAPPAQNATARHSVFVDVELWSGHDSTDRVWSCAYLATVWQLLRLGALRYRGEPVAVPRPWTEPEYPDDWSLLPPVIQLSRKAAPFCAYRTLSVLPRRFHLTEQAVRTILEQVAVDRAVIAQVVERAAAEGLSVPAEVADRVDHIFTGDPPAISRVPEPSPTGP
jgi:hypothetical protein